jgi:hypothetical protein
VLALPWNVQVAVESAVVRQAVACPQRRRQARLHDRETIRDMTPGIPARTISYPD